MTTIILTPELVARTARLCVRAYPGDKIAAIKELRTIFSQIPTGLGLREAKDLVEAVSDDDPVLSLAKRLFPAPYR